MADPKVSSTGRLSSGVETPMLGLGVYQIPRGRATEGAVKFALDAGYGHIDTASLHGSEESVGRAVRESGVPREDVFVTTKLWNSDQGYDPALRASRPWRSACSPWARATRSGSGPG